MSQSTFPDQIRPCPLIACLNCAAYGVSNYKQMTTLESKCITYLRTFQVFTQKCILKNKPFFLRNKRKKCSFTICLIWPHCSTRIPYPRGSWCLLFGLLFHVHRVWTMPHELFSRVEKKIFFLKIQFSPYDLRGIAQEPMPQGSWNLQFQWTLPSSLLRNTYFVCPGRFF